MLAESSLPLIGSVSSHLRWITDVLSSQIGFIFPKHRLFNKMKTTRKPVESCHCDHFRSRLFPRTKHQTHKVVWGPVAWDSNRGTPKYQSLQESKPHKASKRISCTAIWLKPRPCPRHVAAKPLGELLLIDMAL